MKHTWVGDQQPEFAPQVKKLYGPFLVAWFGGIVYVAVLAATLGAIAEAQLSSPPEEFGAIIVMVLLGYALMIPLGVISLWYQGKAYSHFVSSTTFIDHNFSSAITGLGFAGLSIGNALIMLFSLGLASPFVYRRYLDFVENRVSLSGDGDFSDLMQSELGKPTRGEGLADAFDVGAV